MNYRDNLEIDLLDLAKYLLRQWKVLVICMVLGSILAGAFGYLRSGVTVSKDTGKPVTNEAAKVNALRAKLTDESAEFVDIAADQYVDCMNNYRNAVEHTNDSVLLQLDGDNACKLVSLYAIDSDSYMLGGDGDSGQSDGVEAETLGDVLDMVNADDFGQSCVVVSGAKNVISAYKNEIMSDEVIGQVQGALGNGLDNDAVRELIRVGAEGSSVLSVAVYGESEDDVRAAMDVIDKGIEAATEKVKSVYDFEIRAVGTYFSKGMDEYVAKAQSSNANKLSTLRTNLVNIQTPMTADEKAYFKAVVTSEDDDVAAEIAAVEANDSAVDSGETVVVRSINKKYILLGLFGGLFAAAFLYAVLYVLSAKLHVADDLRSAFGLSVIGEVTGKDDKFSLVSKGAAISASKLSSESIYVMGASDDDVSVKVRNAICRELKEENGVSKVEAGSSAVNDAVSMQDLSNSDAVVLVEKVNASAYEDIAREIELCKKFGVKILGAVVVK